MNKIVGREFFALRTESEGKIENLELVDCVFDNCILASFDDIEGMPSVVDVILRNCVDVNSYIGPCYIKNVVVDNLRTADLLIIWGAIFSGVVLKGRLGKVKINSLMEAASYGTALQSSLDKKRDEFYRQSEWALDISKARPLCLEIEGVPSRLIIRDPETQIVVSKEKFFSSEHCKAVANLHEDVEFPLMEFLKSDDPEIILAAPTGRPKKNYQKILDSFAELHLLGFAE